MQPNLLLVLNRWYKRLVPSFQVFARFLLRHEELTEPQKREELTKGLGDRIQEIDKILSPIPTLPKNLQKAITSGAEAVSSIVKQEIQNQGPGVGYMSQSKEEREENVSFLVSYSNESLVCMRRQLNPIFKL